MTTKDARLAPLSGVGFVLTMIGIVAVEGDEADGATAQAVLPHWADRSDTRGADHARGVRRAVSRRVHCIAAQDAAFG